MNNSDNYESNSDTGIPNPTGFEAKTNSYGAAAGRLEAASGRLEAGLGRFGAGSGRLEAGLGRSEAGLGCWVGGSGRGEAYSGLVEVEGLSSGEPELPRYHKRAFAHNYHAPFIYHVILKKKAGAFNFGMVKGDARIIPGQSGCAYIEENILGKIIAKSVLGMQKQFPILQIYQFMVMPDHLHILLRVKDWSDYPLDFYIETLTHNIGNNYSQVIGRRLSGNDIFQPGYCDKPLLLKRSLDGLFRYIRENPHRLAMRQQFPHFFRRVRKFRIADKEYQAYGNLFLFRNPDKEAVKISRRFSEEEKILKRNGWLAGAAKGTVLVSPFISKPEKEIRTEAENLGARIILITHETFGERYKPAAHDFALCAAGRLLIINLGLPPKTPLTRDLCLQMNSLAQTISEL